MTVAATRSWPRTSRSPAIRIADAEEVLDIPRHHPKQRHPQPFLSTDSRIICSVRRDRLPPDTNKTPDECRIFQANESFRRSAGTGARGGQFAPVPTLR
jgi:hypothetical protein